MEVLAIIACWENGQWRYERLMIDVEGNVQSVAITRAEYDNALSGEGAIECENCP